MLCFARGSLIIEKLLQISFEGGLWSKKQPRADVLCKFYPDFKIETFWLGNSYL